MYSGRMVSWASGLLSSGRDFRSLAGEPKSKASMNSGGFVPNVIDRRAWSCEKMGNFSLIMFCAWTTSASKRLDGSPYDCELKSSSGTRDFPGVTPAIVAIFFFFSFFSLKWS